MPFWIPHPPLLLPFVFSVTIFCILTGEFPFNFGANIVRTAIVRKAKRPGQLRIELDGKMKVFGLSVPCREFVLSLMVVEPDGRTAAGEALSLPWLHVNLGGRAPTDAERASAAHAVGRQFSAESAEHMAPIMSHMCEVRRPRVDQSYLLVLVLMRGSSHVPEQPLRHRFESCSGIRV